VTQNPTTFVSLELTRAALLAHGIEVFRVDEQSIQLAVRVRHHLMDAGVSVHFEPDTNVLLTVRVQGSDHPGLAATQLFGKIRDAIADTAAARSFHEHASHCREIRDPGDDSRILDLWYELTFAKPARDTSGLLDDVSWALGVPKCIDY
jgi:hypothetical protein